jgi:hypothetical protein
VYFRASDWDNRVQITLHPEMVWSWRRPPFLYPWQDWWKNDRGAGRASTRAAPLVSEEPSRQ